VALADSARPIRMPASLSVPDSLIEASKSVSGLISALVIQVARVEETVSALAG